MFRRQLPPCEERRWGRGVRGRTARTRSAQSLTVHRQAPLHNEIRGDCEGLVAAAENARVACCAKHDLQRHGAARTAAEA